MLVCVAMSDGAVGAVGVSRLALFPQGEEPTYSLCAHLQTCEC